MSRSFIVASIALTSASLTIAASAQAPTSALAPVAERAGLPPEIDSYIESTRQQWNVPGLAIAVVRADKVLAVKGYGVRTLGHSEPVDGETLFNIASLTKSFTSAAAGVLVDEGKLRWDDPVRRWLPWVEFEDPWISREVTLRDLLSHRVGLEARDGAWIFTDVNRTELIRRLRFVKQEAPFRSRQVYSNSLFTLGGETVAAAAGTSWESLVESRLLSPLGMNATGFGIAQGSNVASPHAVIKGKLQPIRQADYTNIGPAGSLHSSASDMAIWMRLQLGRGLIDGKRLISAAAIEQMHQPQTIIPTTAAMRANRQVEFFAGYGLGWTVMDYRGHAAIWHSGSSEGMPVYMILLPKQNVGVLVMTNSWDASILRGELAARILDQYLGLPTKDYAGALLAQVRAAASRRATLPAPIAKNRGKPSLATAEYAGTYHTDLYGDVTVTQAKTGLTLRVGAGEIANLVHSRHDSFSIVWRDAVYAEAYPSTATFRLNPEGRSVSVSLMLDDEAVDAARIL